MFDVYGYYLSRCLVKMKGITGILQLVVCLGMLCMAVALSKDVTDNSSVSTQKLQTGKDIIEQSIKSLEDDVVFTLYTRGHRNKALVMKKYTKKGQSINYNESLPTKFIIHGFVSSDAVWWVKDIKKDYLDSYNYNIITLDWSKRAVWYPKWPWDEDFIAGSMSFNLKNNASTDFSRQMDKLKEEDRQDAAKFYWASVHDVHHVGQLVAEFIDNLVQEFKADPKDIHLVGHSLGAHVSGIAGALVKRGKVGRITGLDPASPLNEEVPNIKRLDKTDALFVDVIHTDTLGRLTSLFFMHFGYREPCGHVDFYPNGGANMPDCTWEVIHWKMCTHEQAAVYFLTSIKNPRRYPAYTCRSMEEVKNTYIFGAGSWWCGEDCCASCPETDVFMGNAALPDHTGLYYAHTMEKGDPHCITRDTGVVETTIGKPNKAFLTHVELLPEILMFITLSSSVLSNYT